MQLATGWSQSCFRGNYMRKGEHTRQEIIRKAAPIFNQRGYDGAALSDLMRATGLEKGGIYRHFSSKEALAAELYLDGLRAYQEGLLRVLDRHAEAEPAIRALVRADARGFVSVTNSGTCSWFEFAQEILRQAGKNNSVKPIDTVQAARAAKRPAYSVLSPAALHALGITVRHWREALPPYLAELRKMGKLT